MVEPQRRGLGAHVLERLRTDLLLGRYRPSQHLPAERELAAQLGTNRNTLREALRTLENEHLLESRQGEGTLVLDWRREGDVALLGPFLTADTDLGERAHALETLLELRERLLDQALIEAVVAADADALDALAAAVEALRWSPPGAATARADLAVFRALVLATHSLTLIWIFNTFARVLEQLIPDYAFAWQNDAAYVGALARLVEQLRQRRTATARANLRRTFRARNAGVLALLRAAAARRPAKPRRGARRAAR